MHILFITAHFEPEQGAAPVIITRLARALRQRGHDITVLTALPNYPQGRVCDGYRGRWQVTEDVDGVRVIRTWLWATPSPKISRKLVSQVSFALTATLRGLRLPRPDAALVEAQPMFTHLAGAALCRARRIPYVLDVHDLWPDHLLTVGAVTAQHPVYRAFRALTNASLRGAAGIICLTPYLTERVSHYARDASKVQTVLSGIDLNRFRPNLDGSAFRAQYGLGNDRLVSFIGAFVTAYDFDTMLAAARLLNGRSGVRMLLAGSGTQAARIDALLADGDQAQVTRIGWVDYDDVPAAYAASDVCFWALRPEPLYRGTMPTKLYEAMAAGLPTAAAVEGVAADFLRETGAGLSAPCGDAVGLAAAVARLLDDAALRARCARAGRAYAEAHLDYARAADAYQAMLMQAAER
ncbi:MAG: glycosyltransferase family 4 protein [Aggregatilineales bacterium]